MAANLSIGPGIAYDGYPVPLFGPNLLSYAQSSLEDGTVAGWANNGNCTPSNSTAAAFDGTHCLAMTSVAAGNMSAFCGGAPLPLLHPIIPGYPMTVSAWVMAATVARTITLTCLWYDKTPAFLAQNPVVTFPTAETTTGWNQVIASFNPPPAAILNGFCAAPMVTAAATAGAGEVHYVDLVTLQVGIFYSL